MSANATRVLVVDDEPEIVRGLKIVLRGAGYAVEAASTKGEALASVAKRPPEALVLDLVLPDGDGVGVCTEVRRWSRLPILVLSAVGDEREKVRALDAGADDYVTKPFGTDELLARLRAVLRRSPDSGHAEKIETRRPDRRPRGSQGAPRRLKKYTSRRSSSTSCACSLSIQDDSSRNVSCCRKCGGPQYAEESHYLRVHIAHIRSKIERDPSRPRYLITEPGVGYRLRDSAS